LSLIIDTPSFTSFSEASTDGSSAIGTDEYERFAMGQTTWVVLKRYRPLLFNARGLRLSEWIEDESAVLVKAGAGRTIHRVRTDGIDIYVKHFSAHRWSSRLHQLIRRGRAQKEFETARMLRSHRVPTIVPIALGEHRRNGFLHDSYLISESITNGVTLFDLIERFVIPGRLAATPRFRFEFAEALGRLAARIHNAGVEHRDLHERNIVVRPRQQGGFDFFMLDLHELRLRPGREWRWAERDLSRMGRYFTLRTSSVDRRRFFEAYAQERLFSPSTISRQAVLLERAVVESRADFWRRRDIRGPSKYNRINEYRAPGVRALSVPELPESFVRGLMANQDRFFDESVSHWCKRGRSTRVAEVLLPQIRHGESLVYKQHFFKGWHESLATIFRPNQAERAWNNAAALILRELPTPKPLVLLHRIQWGLPVSSYLLTERINGMGLREYVESHRNSNTPAQESRRIVLGVLAATARLIRTMHDRRVTHRDLKASNILASTTANPAQPDLWLIDLDGVSTWRTIPPRHIWQNLARINVSFLKCGWISHTDRLRFLRLYLGRDFQNKRVWKALWHHVARESVAKINKNLRRGRSIL
jgi:tRNA A-37 threonylcarbamoyl transferase component Bud32